MPTEPIYVDISDNPQLKALADEVQRSGTPRVLREDGHDVAVISPARPEVKLADPHDIWAGYDPERVRAALEAGVGVGAFDGVDIEQLKRDIRDARGQKERRRRPTPR